MKHHLEDGGRGSFNKKKFQTFDQEEEVEATGFRAKLKQFLLDPQNAMPIIITVEIVRVLIIFLFEISSEMGHNKEMLFADNFESSGYDYEKIFGDSYSAEAYPAIGLYLGLLEYNLSDGGRNPGVGKGISGLFYIATVWCVVRIYQNAFKDQPKYSNIVLLLCFMLFPVTISVSGCALDLKALFFCLFSMLMFQNGDQHYGIIAYSIGLSTKMEAFYFLPSICYLMAISCGQFLACWGLLFILILQCAFAFPFIAVNPGAYFMHSYIENFRRTYDTSQSMTWGFLPDSIGHNTIFMVVLTLAHGSILKTMLFFRLLKVKSMFKDLNVYPLNLFPKFTHQNTKFITEVFFFLFLAGIVTFKGATPEKMIWWIFSVPFLLHSTGYNFQKRGYIVMIGIILALDMLYMFRQFRVCRILSHLFLLWVFLETMFLIIKERHLKHYNSHVDIEMVEDGEASMV